MNLRGTIKRYGEAQIFVEHYAFVVISHFDGYTLMYRSPSSVTVDKTEHPTINSVEMLLSKLPIDPSQDKTWTKYTTSI